MHSLLHLKLGRDKVVVSSIQASMAHSQARAELHARNAAVAEAVEKANEEHELAMKYLTETHNQQLHDKLAAASTAASDRERDAIAGAVAKAEQQISGAVAKAEQRVTMKLEAEHEHKLAAAVKAAAEHERATIRIEAVAADAEREMQRMQAVLKSAEDWSREVREADEVAQQQRESLLRRELKTLSANYALALKAAEDATVGSRGDAQEALTVSSQLRAALNASEAREEASQRELRDLRAKHAMALNGAGERVKEVLAQSNAKCKLQQEATGTPRRAGSPSGRPHSRLNEALVRIPESTVEGELARVKAAHGRLLAEMEAAASKRESSLSAQLESLKADADASRALHAQVSAAKQQAAMGQSVRFAHEEVGRLTEEADSLRNEMGWMHKEMAEAQSAAAERAEEDAMGIATAMTVRARADAQAALGACRELQARLDISEAEVRAWQDECITLRRSHAIEVGYGTGARLAALQGDSEAAAAHAAGAAAAREAARYVSPGSTLKARLDEDRAQTRCAYFQSWPREPQHREPQHRGPQHREPQHREPHREWPRGGMGEAWEEEGMLAMGPLPSSEHPSANQELRDQELKARWKTARWLARCEADPQWQREQTEPAPYTPPRSRGSPSGTLAASSPGLLSPVHANPAHANGWADEMSSDHRMASAAFRQLALDGARRPQRLSAQLGGFASAGGLMSERTSTIRQTPSLSRSGLLV